MARTLFLSLLVSGFLISFAFGQNSGAANAVPRPKNVNSSNSAANAAADIAIGQPESSYSTVRGRVYYEDSGRPVKRSSLMLVTTDRITGSGEFSAMTDGNGEFVMRSVRAGTYYAMVNAPGVISPIAFLDLSRMEQQRSGSDKDMLTDGVSIFEKIIIDGAGEVYLQIPAKRGAAIGGRISYENGDPAIGARVEIMRKVNGKYIPVFSNLFSIMNLFSGSTGSGQTDDRGMYRFSGLPPGEYIVRVSESAQHTEGEQSMRSPMGFGAFLLGSSSFLSFYFPNVTDVKDAQVLSVAMGQEFSETNIVIPDNSLFNLSGKVISGKDKKPVSGAKVSLKKNNEGVFSLFGDIGREMNTAVTDDEGNWKFKEMPKGEYSIQVEPSNRANATGEDEYAANSNVLRRPMPSAPKFARKFQDVKIDDKDVADVIVELGYGALISGTVSTANSRIMPTTFSIDAVREDGESAASDTIYSYPDRESGENGRKTASDFKLENAASGKINLKFYSNDGDYYVKSAQSGMTDLLTTPLELKDGDSIINIKIELADDAGTLKGRVLDEENHPVSGVRLLLVPTDAAKRRASNLFKNTRSDLEGRFEIKLPPGEYAILLSKAGLEELSRDDFNKWLDEAMRSPDKVSIEPNGNSTVTVKKPGK